MIVIKWASRVLLETDSFFDALGKLEEYEDIQWQGISVTLSDNRMTVPQFLAYIEDSINNPD